MGFASLYPSYGLARNHARGEAGLCRVAAHDRFAGFIVQNRVDIAESLRRELFDRVDHAFGPAAAVGGDDVRGPPPAVALPSSDGPPPMFPPGKCRRPASRVHNFLRPA